MVNQIPRQFRITEPKRREAEQARMAERRDGSRKAAATTVGSGGRLDVVGGDLTVMQGGNAAVRDGGRFLVEGGGSMDITDDGQINAVGEGRHRFTREIVKVTASLANRMMTNLWESVTYLQAGLYFNTGGESRGALDPRVVSEDGKSVSTISSVEKLMYGPQVGPNIMSSSVYKAESESAAIASSAWDDSINQGGGDGTAGLRGAGSVSVSPRDISILLTNHTEGPDGIPSGPAIWMRGDLEDGMLRIYTRNGVDIEGAFTVNGQPVGGAVTSVAGKTGAVLLVKGDVGLGSVDNTSDANKPVSNATQTALNGKAPTTHTHTTAQVTGLDAALAGKAASTHGHNNATSTTPGFMSPTDKGKLDGATAGLTTNTVMYRDAWGRAQIADPVGADDVANKRAVDKKADASYTPSTQATIGAGFSHYNSSGWTGVRYTEKNGFVEITGAFAKGSWGPGEIIARLPQSMWPPAKKAGIKCEIGTTGEISTIVSGTGADSIGAMYIR